MRMVYVLTSYVWYFHAVMIESLLLTKQVATSLGYSKG